STSARLPVQGTIARGMLPEDAENSIDYLYSSHYATGTNEEYLTAGELVKNPIPRTEEVVLEGQRLFNINCSICHGDGGKGDGVIIENGKFPAPPTSYFDDLIMNMPDGQMFHSISFGKNMMGSYASQLNSTERWSVIHYIRTLQEKEAAISDDKADADESEDETADAGTETEEAPATEESNENN
ncbi:MAG: c-type cytochrome, partial [Bacteroidetes bacterium]|nr:c-type cytochrome [Bacteroidota bacterium]